MTSFGVQVRRALVGLQRCANWAERRRLAGYLVRRQIGHVDSRSLLELRFKDMSLTINEADSQLASYFEIAVEHIYDQSPAVVAKPGWTVVDVGANIGVFSVCQARRGARVFAYEPHPRAFANLASNLRANGVESLVSCVNAAVSNSEGSGWLATDTGSTSSRLSLTVTREGFEVPTVTLDASLAELGVSSVDLLKIDVEGTEIAVLAGASVTLERASAAIIEVHGLESEVDKCMAEHGFRRDPAGRYPNLYYSKDGSQTG